LLKNYSKIIELPPFEQWLTWEQESNVLHFRKKRNPIQIPFLEIPIHELNVTLLPSLSNSLNHLINQGQMIRWFKHPFNQEKSLPYFKSKTVGALDAFETASRSLAFQLGNEYYSIKAPTDFPHGPKGVYQPDKSTTKEDINDAIHRMELIDKIESEIGTDPTLILAKEIVMVSEKKSGEGYLIRDLSFMKSGNYYLPAFSIPFVGREIALHNKATPEMFWKSAYAEVLGKAKAKLLLRYGLQMETPNPQNMLIELDSDLKPTARIVFRDISDTELVESVSLGLGDYDSLVNDNHHGVKNTKIISPDWRLSAWNFNTPGNGYFDFTIIDWGKTHDKAYKKEIENALGVDLSQFETLDKNINFYDFMSSDFVQKKLRNYRKRLKLNH
jgi:hypothetical protein